MAQRLQQEIANRATRLQRRMLTDRYRKLTAVIETLGNRLARLTDGAPTESGLTKLFHLALERQRATGAELEANR